MVARRARPGQSPPTEGNPRTEAARIKALDPGLRRGDESCPDAVPETKAPHARRQWRSRAGSSFPSAAPSAARGRRELSRRCLSPPGRVSTRPAGRRWSEAPAKPALRQGAFFIHLSCRHKKDGRLPGETRPITANRRHLENRSSKDQRLWTRPAPGRRIVPGCRARNEGATRRRQWRSRAGQDVV